MGGTYDLFTDDELAAMLTKARSMAADAPRSSLRQPSDAWARWSAECRAIKREIEARAAQ